MDILDNIIILVLILIGILIAILIFWPKTGPWGINLKRVKCPNCNNLVPIIRKPKNKTQAMWGGWTCDKCGTEIDKYGNIRDSSHNDILQPEASVVVTFDSNGIRCFKPESKEESITWEKLDAVLLETTDDGPMDTDIFWLLLSKEDMSSGCLIPQGATGDKELLSEMQERLAGFDNEMLIKAMGSTVNQRYLIWERKIS